MKPIEEQKTITVYKCGDCGREHSDASSAESCCACTSCGGPTTAEDRKIARGVGGSVYYYRTDLVCEWCRVRKSVKAQQEKVHREESNVEQAKRRLEAAERELKKEQDELAQRTAKRDALPPKPRAPKKESAA